MLIIQGIMQSHPRGRSRHIPPPPLHSSSGNKSSYAKLSCTAALTPSMDGHLTYTYTFTFNAHAGLRLVSRLVASPLLSLLQRTRAKNSVQLQKESCVRLGTHFISFHLPSRAFCTAAAAAAHATTFWVQQYSTKLRRSRRVLIFL